MSPETAEMFYGPFCKRDDDCERREHEGVCGLSDGTDFDDRRDAIVARLIALVERWESDDCESLDTFGQHLMGGAVLVCAEQLRAALAIGVEATS